MMDRIYHTWDKWECYPAGFYGNRPPSKDLTTTDCRQAYADFLANITLFENAMAGVLQDWPNSCEHYLSNERMNRIAWLGQSAMCYETGIPSVFCGGYFLLTEEQRLAADQAALNTLNRWLVLRGEASLSTEEAASKTAANLY
jgi:hypothetical protein